MTLLWSFRATMLLQQQARDAGASKKGSSPTGCYRAVPIQGSHASSQGTEGDAGKTTRTAETGIPMPNHMFAMFTCRSGVSMNDRMSTLQLQAKKESLDRRKAYAQKVAAGNTKGFRRVCCCSILLMMRMKRWSACPCGRQPQYFDFGRNVSNFLHRATA